MEIINLNLMSNNLSNDLTNVQPDELEQGKEYNIQIYCDDIKRLYKNAVNKFIIKYSGVYTITNISHYYNFAHTIYELKNNDNDLIIKLNKYAFTRIARNINISSIRPYYVLYGISGFICRKDGKKCYEVIINNEKTDLVEFENENDCEIIQYIDLGCKITEISMYVLK